MGQSFPPKSLGPMALEVLWKFESIIWQASVHRTKSDCVAEGGEAKRDRLFKFSSYKTGVAISCAPYRIQNPSDPQNTPQNTLRNPSRNQNTKKIRKKYENPRFSYFFVFFSYFGFGRGFGVYFGVYFGDQRGFVFCTGRRRSQNRGFYEFMVFGDRPYLF